MGTILSRLDWSTTSLGGTIWPLVLIGLKKQGRYMGREVMDKCPFCGSVKIREAHFASGLHELFKCDNIFVQNELYGERHLNCYKTQLAYQTALLGEAQKAINSLTGFSECIYDCSIVPTYQESEAAANDVVIKIDEELRKIK